MEQMIRLGDAIQMAGRLGRGEYLRYDRPDLKAGERLAPSRVWRNGVETDRLLRGTSCLTVRHPYSQHSLASAYEGRVYVVTGRRVGTGQDAGEVVLADCTVVRAL